MDARLLKHIGFVISFCSLVYSCNTGSDGSGEAKDSSVVDSSKLQKLLTINLDSVKIFIPFNKNGIALVEDQNSRWSFAKQNGELILPWQDYEFGENTESDNGIERFNNDLSGKNAKWGYLNKTGSVYIPFEYDFAYPFKEGLAGVVKNNKVGFINPKGELKIGFQFEYKHDQCEFSYGRARVTLNGKDCYIDKAGKVVIPPKYKDCDPFFSEGLVFVKDNVGEAYYIDTLGHVAIDFSQQPYYVNVNDNMFSDGRLLVQDDVSKKYGYIDRQGRIVIECKYDNARGFNKGIAGVFNNKPGRWGFINKFGKVKIPFKYTEMTDNEYLEITSSFDKK
jgi:hypothetical protein